MNEIWKQLPECQEYSISNYRTILVVMKRDLTPEEEEKMEDVERAAIQGVWITVAMVVIALGMLITIICMNA